MNYYQARQRQTDGRWDYTCFNRRLGTWPVGNCAATTCCDCVALGGGFRVDPRCERCEGTGRVPNPDHCGGHDTADEACECYRRWLIENAQMHGELGEPDGCGVCGRLTSGYAVTAGGAHHMHVLCPEHRTREVLRELVGPVGQIVSSY